MMITPIKQKDVSAILKDIKNTADLRIGSCNCDCNCNCDCSKGESACNCNCKKPEKPGNKPALKVVFSLLVAAIAVFQGNRAMAQDTGEQLVMTFDTGYSQVSVLSEEQRPTRADALTGATPQMMQAYLPDGSCPGAVNAFLVRTPDKNILVDAGYGRKLFDHLHALELAVEDIHIILLTHMHADHIGGLLRNETVAFPKAELYLSQPEYDYWMSDRAMEAAPDRRNGFLQARKVIAAYGHTPGHTAYLFHSGGADLLIWGDVNHAMRIQMPCPDVTYARDSNPAQSIETRKRILAYVAEKNIPVAGMHIAFPGIGDVVSTGNGSYAFEPYCLCLGI